MSTLGNRRFPMSYLLLLMETKMFYRVEVNDHIRVPPRFFAFDVNEAVLKAVKQKYD